MPCSGSASKCPCYRMNIQEHRLCLGLVEKACSILSQAQVGGCCTVLSHAQAPKHKVQDVSSWMTGIQEVPLPMAYKLRNIEDTEAAKKRLLASSAAATSQCAQQWLSTGVLYLMC